MIRAACSSEPFLSVSQETGYADRIRRRLRIAVQPPLTAARGAASLAESGCRSYLIAGQLSYPTSEPMTPDGKFRNLGGDLRYPGNHQPPHFGEERSSPKPVRARQSQGSGRVERIVQEKSLAREARFRLFPPEFFHLYNMYNADQNSPQSGA